MPSFPLEQVPSLSGLIFKELSLDSETQALVLMLSNNKLVTETATFELADFSFENQSTIPTGIEGVDLTLAPRASADLQLRLYAPDSEMKLAEISLPELHSASMVQVVPGNKIACGLELSGALGLNPSAQGTVNGWSLGLSGEAELEVVLRFFKILPKSTKARVAVEKTLKSLTTVFNLTSNSLQAGEVVVADFRGMLKLGANLGYGWEIAGTKRTTPGLDIELAGSYEAKAQLGLSADITLNDDFEIVIQPTGIDKWVNVSFMKKFETDTSFAANLHVVADLDTKIGLSGQTKTDAGPFIDSLLNRTSLPDIIAELQRFDSPEEQTAELQTLASDLADRLTGELQSFLGAGIERIEEEVLIPIRERLNEWLEAYREIDTEIAGLLSQALEKLESKEGIDEAIEQIDAFQTSEELLQHLIDEHGSQDLRDLLEIIGRVLGIDLSQVSLVEDAFTNIKTLVATYRAQKNRWLQRYADAYVWLKKQLRIDEAIEKIERVDTQQDLQALVDEEILWLNQYLQQELQKPISEIVEALAPATQVLAKITSGYDRLVSRAKEALEGALQQELDAKVALTWNYLKTNQTLASIDVNLAEDAGKQALRRLIRGDVADVMRSRLSNAHAIRFKRSQFLDALRRSITVRVAVNARESINIKSYLVSSSAVLEPTDNGEIWVATSRSGEQVLHSSRRGMINAGTMFEVATSEEFVRNEGGRVLVSQGQSIERRSLRYSYLEESESEMDGGALADRLNQIHKDIDLKVVPINAFSDLIERVQEIGVRRGPFNDISIEIAYEIRSTALALLLEDLSPAEVERRFRIAWDDAVPEVFGDLDKVIGFYREKKRKNGKKTKPFDLSELQSEARGLSGQEQTIARELLHKRDSFPELMRKFHKDAFLKLDPKAFRGLLKDLGKSMNRLNSNEALKRRPRHRQDRTRNFIMTVFSYAVESTDTGGSLVVRYRDPLTEKPMQLRAVEPLIENT